MTLQCMAIFPCFHAKAHVSKHACWLIQHVEKVGECVLPWGEAGIRCFIDSEKRLGTCHCMGEKRKGETKQGEMTTGQERGKMLTLHKLECGEVEQLPWTCCTRSVLDPVDGLLCMLPLHWQLDRENRVLKTEEEHWWTPSLMSQGPWKEPTISTYGRLFQHDLKCGITLRIVHPGGNLHRPCRPSIFPLYSLVAEKAVAKGLFSWIC